MACLREWRFWNQMAIQFYIAPVFGLDTLPARPGQSVCRRLSFSALSSADCTFLLKAL